MRNLFITIFILLSFSVIDSKVYAEVKLPAIIGSHMVMLQNSEVNLWGWANPGEPIQIRVDWDTTTYTSATGFRTGKWFMKIKTPKAGGPYKIIIKGSNEITLEDVMIGEVWLCGGQSNMEISAAGGIKQAQDEVPNATNSNIRFFYVPKSASDYPQDDTKGKWVICTPADMQYFSAVGYFFGKRLQEELQQPVGLINANWGGTGVEVWTPAELINNNPSFKEAAETTALTNDCCPIEIGSLFNGMISPIKNFMPGMVKIEGNSIVISNKNIKKPVAVRFGFSNEAIPNLFNKEGLPVNLFRTDEWIVPTEPIVQKKNRPVVGAIRWDAWVGTLNRAGLEVEHSLSPHQYHYRAPFYSKEISYDSIQCRGTTQGIMDQEIAYAKYSGLDYWAFCWYPPHSGLDTSRQLYLESSHKSDIKWCVILGTNPFDYNTDGAWLIQRFKEDNYQKVLNGRPLVYVFPGTVTRPELTQLRNLSKAAGIPEPYIAVMAFSAKTAVAMADSLNADALSAYISWTGKNGEPYYPVIPKADSTGWENYKATGRKVIPWVTLGHNTRPRIDNPVSWTKVAPDQWVSDGTPQELAANLSNALQWINKNKSTVEANAVLMYAWNEFDEGGWLCPTLGNNTSRLDAIEKVLKSNKIKIK